MDAGGSIQMTYNNNHRGFPSANGGLGIPGAGFASRGKGNGIKRLNLASPPKVSSISENPSDPLPSAPRTSRSHLLAGLRTAPKASGEPASAPYYKTVHKPSALNQYGQPNYHLNSTTAIPHTAIGSNFPSVGQPYNLNAGQHFYSLPEQVLAPPPLEIDEAEEHMDPQMVAQLYATKVYLAQRQQQLQQLLQFQTAQQLGALQLNDFGTQGRGQGSYPQTPVTPQLNLLNQQAQQAVSHIFTQEIAGQPGMYLVYNAITGQSTLAFDPSSQPNTSIDLSNSPPPPTPSTVNATFQSDNSPPFASSSPAGSRSRSPPKKSTSPPVEVTPLPPPSANAFRRGHVRNRSSLVINTTNGATNEGPKSAFIPRSNTIPPTPLTGMFGPGQARAGEHPVRQPYGPPPLEELQAKPTTKHEGSKNFATRQRRRALNTLMRAGIERRAGNGTPRPGSSGADRSFTLNGNVSAGNVTPVSDSDLTYSGPSSDNERDGTASEPKVLAQPSAASLRALNSMNGSEHLRTEGATIPSHGNGVSVAGLA